MTNYLIARMTERGRLAYLMVDATETYLPGLAMRLSSRAIAAALAESVWSRDAQWAVVPEVRS